MDLLKILFSDGEKVSQMYVDWLYMNCMMGETCVNGPEHDVTLGQHDGRVTLPSLTQYLTILTRFLTGHQ
jgi:hypothetical protein